MRISFLRAATRSVDVHRDAAISLRLLRQAQTSSPSSLDAFSFPSSCDVLTVSLRRLTQLGWSCEGASSAQQGSHKRLTVPPCPWKDIPKPSGTSLCTFLRSDQTPCKHSLVSLPPRFREGLPWHAAEHFWEGSSVRFRSCETSNAAPVSWKTLCVLQPKSPTLNHRWQAAVPP